MPDRSWLEWAMKVAEQALQVVGEGLLRCAACPAKELVEVVLLLRAERAGIHRLSGLELAKPFLLP
jgi:hypothetical protein